MLLKRKLIKAVILTRINKDGKGWCPNCIYWFWDAEDQRNCHYRYIEDNTINTLCLDLLYGNRLTSLINYAYVIKEV